MSIVYRSGANEFHGSGEVRYQNQPMLHRAWLQQFITTVPYSYGEYTGAVSGPVVIPKLYNGHNKTFFLFDYTLQNEHFNASVTTTVPSLAALGGDFSFPGREWRRIPALQSFHDDAVQRDLHADAIRGQSHPEKPFRSRGREFSVAQSLEGAQRSRHSRPHRPDQQSAHRHGSDQSHAPAPHGLQARPAVRLEQPFLPARVSHHPPRRPRQSRIWRFTFDGDGKIIDSRQQPFPSIFGIF